MKIYLPRQASTCEAGLQYYKCSKGGFSGCCSVDPCDTGSCPDGDGAGTTTTRSTSSSAATSTDATTTFISTTVSSRKTSSTSISTTTSEGLSASRTTGISSTSTTSATIIPSSTSHSNAGLIGGIVGGVVGGILLLGLILAFIWWRRRKRGRQSSLQKWCCCGRRGRSSRGPSDGSVSEGFLGSHDERHSMERSLGKDVKKHHSVAQSDFSTTPSGSSEYEKKASPTLSSPGKITTRPNLGSGERSTSTPEEDPCPLLASIPLIPTTELPASTPSRADTTPELADTQRNRGRAELPSLPERELINMPLETRKNASSWRVNRYYNPIITGQMHTMTTHDGAIMRPNMVQESGEDAISSHARSRNHIMSFMHYDSYNSTPPNSEAPSASPPSQKLAPIPEISITPPMPNDSERRDHGAKLASNSVGLGLSGMDIHRD